MVQFYTDPNLEDFLLKELNSKLGLSIPVIESTHKGFISIALDLDKITRILHHPPTLWTVKRARLALFTKTSTSLEEELGGEIEPVSRILQQLGFSQINCRIATRIKLPLPRRQLLGLLKRQFQQNGIVLQFRKQLPDLLLNINESTCKGSLEIGKSFAYPAPLKVHHTPLSPAVSYALFHLARQFQPQIAYKCLDPMCGNGTLLLVGMEESLQMKIPFFGMGIDIDPTAIANAQENLQAFPHDIVLLDGSIEHFDLTLLPKEPNIILTHPPYGFAPVIEKESLAILYDALFQLFTKFPDSIYGVVTPHLPLLLKLVEKYHLKTEIVRPFQQKTLPSCLWVGRFSQK